MPRQRLYRTPAVVLKRMDLGEADRILTFYSRDHGKVRAVAKGIRRGTSRSAGHLEPFAVADVLFAVGRDLDVVSQADTLEAFRQLREDLVLTTHAYYLVELVDLLTEEHEENRAVFDLLVDGFRQLGAAADHRQVLISFHLHLMEALGYRPELRECVGCHAKIAPERNRFSPQQGGALCSPCGAAGLGRAPDRRARPQAAALPAAGWTVCAGRATRHARGRSAAARLRRAHRRAPAAHSGPHCAGFRGRDATMMSARPSTV